jgi:extradiol dioxygenase family protein
MSPLLFLQAFGVIMIMSAWLRFAKRLRRAGDFSVDAVAWLHRSHISATETIHSIHKKVFRHDYRRW